VVSSKIYTQFTDGLRQISEVADGLAYRKFNSEEIIRAVLTNISSTFTFDPPRRLDWGRYRLGLPPSSWSLIMASHISPTF